MWELDCEKVMKDNLQAVLAKRAEDRWELVNATPDQIGMSPSQLEDYPADIWSYVLFFKRPKRS
jgi:hypothetical protein